MTENKRFTVPLKYLFSHSKIQLNGELLTNDELVRLLNTNDGAFIENFALKKENEQLKQQLDKFEFSQTTNFIEHNTDKLYVKDTHTTIDLKDDKLFIEVEIPSNDDVFRFFYWATCNFVSNEVEILNRFKESG